MLTMQEGAVYVREKRAAGGTDSEISAVLALDGWQHDDIAKVLASVEGSLGPVARVAPVSPIARAPGPIAPVAPIMPPAPAAPIVPIAPIAAITLAETDELPDVGLPPSPLRTAAMLVTPLSGIQGATLKSYKRWHPLRMLGWILVTLIIGGLFGGAEYYAYKNNLLASLKPYVAQYLPFLPHSI